MQWQRFAVPRTFLLPALALLASAVAGCDLTSAEDGRVQIQVTDAASDYLEKADVWISHVYLKCEDKDEDEHEGEHLFASGSESVGAFSRADSASHKHHDDEDDDEHECERVDLLNDPTHAFHVDLLKLRDGLVANLTVPKNLPEGTYHRLYVVVDSAKVTLKAPYKFADGSSTAALRIAGGEHHAIKVDLAQPLDVAAGKTTIVLVDFDVNESFVILGNPNTPAQIKGVLFLPKLREKHRSKH